MVEIVSELQELIANPQETPDVELKSWVNLSDNLAKAKIAKHLASLANHGGGYLIFGFSDDGTPSTPRPDDLSSYNRDIIAGIVESYLDPPFHCDVVTIERIEDGNLYPIIRVPTHGAAPICTKRGGPHDDHGNAQGIRKGVYYTRGPGPKSIPIDSPELWQPIIRRCVLNEREAIVTSISHLLQRPASDQRVEKDEILKWHESSHERYAELLEQSEQEWPVSIADNHYQLSYAISELGGETIHNLDDFKVVHQRSNEAVKNDVWTGWSMFHPFTTPELAPYVLVDDMGKINAELLETNLLSKTGSLPDFWRLSMDGRATIIRPYREDLETIEIGDDVPLEPGSFLSPRTLVRELYELSAHAREISRSFHHAQTIHFMCSWWGLAGRIIRDFDPGVHWHPYTCHAPGRTVRVIATPDELVTDLPRIACALASPVLILFDGFKILPSWVETIAPSFRSL
ncbi:MAG: ATP-binding protein [Candidatus Glassbacteria bacterium]|nr:ATP-binding protein [Candidatus Glassbacteria bacterium]